MNKIEEVKKILHKLDPFDLKSDIDMERKAREICQLFEPEPDSNASTWPYPRPVEKLKPDESRLLTEEQWIENGGEWRSSYEQYLKILQAQDVKTASIKDARFKELCANCDSWLWKSGEKQEIIDRKNAGCQQRVERIFKDIETQNPVDEILGGIILTPKQWQALKNKALKKQEGVG